MDIKMTKQLYNAEGQPVALPETLEDAKKHRRPHYAGAEACPICESRGFEGLIVRKRYAATETCVHCATLGALELYALATYRAALDTDGGRLLYVILSDNSEREISQEYFDKMEATIALFSGNVPTTPAGAAEMGVSLYIREEPCRKAGHLGVRRDVGDCYFCNELKIKASPRQQAIKAGEKEYVPLEVCSDCGERALKSVSSGQCSGCSSRFGGDGRETPDSLMMRESPDLIISRNDAKTLGFKVYRTGVPCTKGHAGFRYVSTGNCLSCR